MAGKLEGKKIAILATDGFEQVELIEPRRALEEAGAGTDVVAPHSGQIRGWNFTDWGQSVQVDVELNDARPDDYDAIFLPGGVQNPDKLRRDPRALAFVRNFFDAGKPVAAICHGPWTLIDAGVVHGRNMTSYASIQTDLKNAGATWTDEPVVVDQGLVTSRQPSDIPQFNQKMIEEFAEGRHTGQMSTNTSATEQFISPNSMI